MNRALRGNLVLGIVVALILGGTVLAYRLHTASEADEVVRVALGGRTYAIPTAMQPVLHGAPDGLVHSTFLEHRRKDTYLQDRGDPPADVRSFSLGGETLAAYLVENPDLKGLRGISQIIVLHAPGSGPTHKARVEKFSAASQAAGDGPFLRELFQDGSFVVYAPAPILFGAPVEARCNPFAESMMCEVRGQISDDARLRVMVQTADWPVSDWPVLFEAIQDFFGAISIGNQR
jgi:hypothetical protein